MKSILAAALAVPLAVVARPVIDDAHDRVQTTLDPMLDRIGTLVPRTAREIGPSRLALGCEMLPREYGDFENFKEYMPPLGIARARLHVQGRSLGRRLGDGGSIEQVGWGRNYGAKISAFQGNLNRILYDRTMKRYVETCGDDNMVFVPFSHGIDPVRAFPRSEEHGNALHGLALSGHQAGDALFAWLINDITSR